MKILHLLSQIELTGAEVYAITLAEWQKNAGHEVLLVSDELHRKTNVPFLPLAVHRTNAWTRFSSKKWLKTYITNHKIDVVHAHSRAAVRLAHSCCRQTSCALVTTLHGKPHRSWSKKIFDIYGDKVISICENLTVDLIQNMKMKSRKISTIPNPVDFGKITFNSQPKKQTSFHLAVVGRTSGPKGDRVAELLQNVFPQLLEEFPHLHIHLVGGDVAGLKPSGQEQFHLLKQKYFERIQNTSFVPELESRLNNYDFIIGAGRVAMVSLACGLPVWALGEAESAGLVTEKSYSAAKRSNFGDIHHDFLHRELNATEITSELKKIIADPQFLTSQSRHQLAAKIVEDFSLDKIAEQVLDVYKSSIFKKKYPRWIPVLMYHKIPDAPLKTRHRIFVTKDNFERHLAFFKRKGFQTLSFSDLKEFRDQKRDFSQFPRKPLLLTFDDGYLNNLENAVPLLEKYGFKATFFMLASHGISENSWDKADGTPQLPLMNSSQRKELFQRGQEIGSHGFSHMKLTSMNHEETRQELLESKKALEAEFQTSISVYAYTYGIKNEFAESLAHETGYTYAVNTSTGGLHIEDNPHSIFRVSIFPEDGPRELRKKTHSLYRLYYYLKRRQ